MPITTSVITGTVAHKHSATGGSGDGGKLATGGLGGDTSFDLANGSLMYSNGTSLDELVTASDGDQLELSGGLPTWQTPAGASLTWEKMGSVTLGVAATTMEVGPWALADVKDFYQIFIWTGNGGGTIRRYVSFADNAGVFDVANNYAVQMSTNFGASVNSPNLPGVIGYDNNSELDSMIVCAADPNQSKLVIREAIVNSNNSSATAPTNRQLFGKWANVGDSIRGVRCWDGGAGGLFAVGSCMLVLGTNL